VQSLTADIFNETGLAGSREAFVQAFTELAKNG
jgi:heterodisulfide reductase subunit D